MAATSEMDYQSDEVKKVIFLIFIEQSRNFLLRYIYDLYCENDFG